LRRLGAFSVSVCADSAFRGYFQVTQWPKVCLAFTQS
jgi:hypothetical protein